MSLEAISTIRSLLRSCLRHRGRLLAGGAGLAAALAVMALSGGGAGQARPAPRPPQPAVFRPTAEQLANLRLATVGLRSFRSVLVTDGNIAFNDDRMTPVFSPYSGRVTRLIARLGEVVKKGAPLLAIDASEFNQGAADVAATRVAVETARAAEKRQHELYEARSGALKDWLQAQADLAQAEANHAAARGRLRILGKSEAEIDLLEKGGHTSAEAIVTAPISGTVTQRQVGLGQYLASATGGAATPVYTIGDLSTVWLVGNVREADAPRLKVGQEAEVRVMALPGRTFKARIGWVAAAVDPVTHRLPVRAEVQNPGGELKPMMFASFSIATGAPAERPAVPEGALLYEGDRTRVFVVAADGSIAGREIRIGRSQDGLVEVADGLKAGERVVSGGTLFVDRAISAD